MSYFDGILQEMHFIHEAKQADYVGDNPDTLASFRASANLLGVSVSQLILGRCMDKVIRMAILLKRDGYNPAVKDESVRDTALDLAVYGALLVESIDDKVKVVAIQDKKERLDLWPYQSKNNLEDSLVDSTDCYRIGKANIQCDCRSCEYSRRVYGEDIEFDDRLD